MCFTISDNKQWNKPRIAKKDIIVWKVFGSISEDYCISQFLDFSYTYNIQYNTVFTYSNRKIELKDTKNIEQGFHSYSKKAVKMFYKNGKRRTIKCIIPKGTRYYYNPEELEYVSNSIIVTNERFYKDKEE